jgi:hypothetical protein
MNAIIGAAAAVSMKAMRDREEAEEEARKPLPFLARCKQLERSARTMHRMTRAYIPMPTYYIRRSSS